MKKQLTFTTLVLCAGLITNPSFADDLNYRWSPANCLWDGGCRYTYQVPNPPPGKRWALEVRSNHPVNDRKVWIVGGNSKVSMNESGFESGTGWLVYRGEMSTKGEIEFWMPRAYDGRDQNKAWIKGTLISSPHFRGR